MSYSLVYSAKPHSTTSILIYDQNTHLPISTIKSCAKLIDAIFTYAFKYKAPKRLHVKGNKYMYVPSDEYFIRVKDFGK